MSGFAIKRAFTQDIPTIIAVQKQTWWATYESIIGKEQCDYMFETLYSEDALTGQIEKLDHRFFLLFNDELPCGLASYSALDEEGVFKLHKIYVTPATQGTGAGKFLISEIEQKVKTEGASELRLNVNRFNPARGFYEKMGYTVQYEEDIPIGPYWMNDYLMSKML